MPFLSSHHWLFMIRGREYVISYLYVPSILTSQKILRWSTILYLYQVTILTVKHAWSGPWFSHSLNLLNNHHLTSVQLSVLLVFFHSVDITEVILPMSGLIIYWVWVSDAWNIRHLLHKQRTSSPKRAGFRHKNKNKQLIKQFK